MISHRHRGMVIAALGVATAPLCIGCAQSQLSDSSLSAKRRHVIAGGVGSFDAATGQFTFGASLNRGALLDASNSLVSVKPANCSTAIWSSSTQVLSVNARLSNNNATETYLGPIELRLTGISPAGIVTSVNTELSGAGCGKTGLTLTSHDADGNGNFDCILPDDTTNTADDPGWDYTAYLGGDDALAPGEQSLCRLLQFNLVTEADFGFQWDVLGIVGSGWPPVPTLDPVASATSSASQTVSGRCVTTSSAPDSLNPGAGALASPNDITIEGGSSPVTVSCTDAIDCQNSNGTDYCGTFSASVPLNSGVSNGLSVYQTLNGSLRGPSAFTTIIQDGAPPTVTSTSPVNGATAVAAASNVMVSFSEPMLPSTIESTDAATANLYVSQAGAREPAVVTLDASGTIATINPNGALLDETTYDVVVTTGVTDLASNPLAAQFSTAFTTSMAGSDTTSPTVSATQPTTGAAGIDRRASIVIIFSESMLDGSTTDPLSPNCEDSLPGLLCSALTVVDVATGATVPGTRTLSPDGLRLTYTVNDPTYDTTGPDTVTQGGCVAYGISQTPEADFDCQTQYRVTVTTALSDLAGNALSSDYSFTFSTAIEPDNTPPGIASVVPADGAMNVAASNKPRVLFTEPMSAASFTSSSATLKKDGITTVSGVRSLSADGLTLQFTPSMPMEVGARYVLFVNDTVTDVAGNMLNTIHNSDFTVSATPDITPPSITSISPADQTSNVAETASVSIYFNEAMAPGTLSTATIKVDRYKQGSTTIIDASVDGSVTTSADGLSATFVPLGTMMGDRWHRLTVSAQVTDLSGNSLGTAQESQFKVVKKDEIAPCVSQISPADGSDNLPTNAVIAVSFSEPMAADTLIESNFLLVETGSQNPIAKSLTYTSTLTSVTLTPGAPLPTGGIQLTVTNGLTDNSALNNVLDQGSTAPVCIAPSGPSEPTFNFTVVSETDTTAPTIVSISPADQSLDVNRATNLVVTFSEAINPGSLNDDNMGLFTDASGNSIASTRTVSAGGNVVTIDPSVLLESFTTYTINIAGGGPRDLAGNALQTGAAVEFRTIDSSSDTTGPSVVSTCPADNTANVDGLLNLAAPCDAYPGEVVVLFDEIVNGSTIGSGTVRLIEFGGQEVDITSSVVLEPDAMTVRIIPIFSGPGGLKAGKTYYIVLSPTIEDSAGNTLVVQDLCNRNTGEGCFDFDT